MFLSALDPDLLIFEQGHWSARLPHFVSRIKALAVHRKFTRQHNQQMAMSNTIAAAMQESFPWSDSYRHIPEWRDLRQFIFDDLSKTHFVSSTKDAIELSVQPSDVTCRYVSNVLVSDAWKELLYGCIEEEACSLYEVQVATWKDSIQFPNSQSLTVAVSSTTGNEDYHLPLVWDENSWNNRLFSQDAWPDLQRCVQLYFNANSAMQTYPHVREQPIPFEWTERFWKSVADSCQPNMRHLLIRAIAKKVYGILDKGLSDESLGEVRRFRVTDFWRVHYHHVGGIIMLEEFGEHDMGL